MTATSKWTAFLLSACLPGAGQLAARSWTCLAWFAAAACLAAAFTHGGSAGGGGSMVMQVAGGVLLCLLSAEHAKRLLERGQGSTSNVVRTRLNRSAARGRTVSIAMSLEVARSAEQLWRMVSDLPQFLTIDPFHERVTLMRERPAVGVDLTLWHNAFGLRFLRFGRIIAWQENSGYAFSDLSARGPQTGFPHVFTVQVEALPSASGAAARSRLTVRVDGRWTSSLVPVWAGRCWIWLVCREHLRLLRKGL
jgi:hypothetical protein